jgi:hypothetical protein
VSRRAIPINTCGILKKKLFPSYRKDEMARWTSKMDVLADLNTLSNFSGECDCRGGSSIESYSSYGRGSSIEDRKLSGLPSPLLNMVLFIKNVYLIEVSVITFLIQIV